MAVTLIETSPSKKRLFSLFSGMGLILGGCIYLPLLIHDDWLGVEVINRSIFYDVRFLSDGLITRELVGLAYAAIITLPMLLSTNAHIMRFGVLIVISGLPVCFSYYYAFTSVWCFFAGVVSLYIAYILSRVSRYEAVLP